MELRLHIISFNTRNLAKKSNPSQPVELTHQYQIKHMILKYSLASREFGALVQETCYTHNTFLISSEHKKKHYLPPLKYRRLIRRLEVNSDWTLSRDRSIRLLERLSTGVYGFDHLQFLKVRLYVYSHVNSELTTWAWEMLERDWRFTAQEGEVVVLPPKGMFSQSNTHNDEELYNTFQERANGSFKFGLP
jgi:hypothetical protein